MWCRSSPCAFYAAARPSAERLSRHQATDSPARVLRCTTGLMVVRKSWKTGSAQPFPHVTLNFHALCTYPFNCSRKSALKISSIVSDVSRETTYAWMRRRSVHKLSPMYSASQLCYLCTWKVHDLFTNRCNVFNEKTFSTTTGDTSSAVPYRTTCKPICCLLSSFCGVANTLRASWTYPRPACRKLADRHAQHTFRVS